jgi:hypothetical protein
MSQKTRKKGSSTLLREANKEVSKDINITIGSETPSLETPQKIGLRNVSWKKIVFAATPVLLLISCASVYYAGKTALPDALVAWGTILLAFITYLAIKENIRITDENHSQNERIINENRRQQLLRDQREHDTRRLDQIEQWAKDIMRYSTFLSSIITKQELGALSELEVLDLMSTNIVHIINSCETELLRSVKQTSDELHKLVITKSGYKSADVINVQQSIRGTVNAVAERRRELII